MNAERIRGLWPGGFWGFWSRHRPLVSAVAAVALVVALPRLVVDASPTASSDAAREADGGEVAQPGAGGGPNVTAAAGPDGPAGPGTVGGTQGPGQRPVVSLAAYPGVGTPEAMANPRCDPATGRIRFPSQYAPECVKPWPAGADNGGATAQGVTADAIRIVFVQPPPSSSSSVTPEQIRTQVRETMNAFADHYELWGRKLDIKFYTLSGTDEASQRAAAIQVANELKPFMASSYLFLGGDTPRVWSTELAARGVINWDESVTFAESQAQAGYRWAMGPDDRFSALNLGEYVGKRLAGRPARFAGDEKFKKDRRSFGLVYDDAWDHGTFEQTLKQYGGALTDAVSYSPFTDLATLQQQANTQIARLKAKGVNNVIVVGGALPSGLLTRAATQQNYFPEWTISGWKLQDVAVLSRVAMDQEQWSHAFGIGLVPPLESPIAISERNQIFQWAYGRQPPSALEATNGEAYLLARNVVAGLHLAGPNLNATTFRKALFTMRPKGGRTCGCVTNAAVSFGRHIPQYPGDKYFETDDYAEKWWDTQTKGEDEVGLVGQGVYQIVDGGRRFVPGSWPTTEPAVFDRSKSLVGYTESPPNDRSPAYPPPPR